MSGKRFRTLEQAIIRRRVVDKKPGRTDKCPHQIRSIVDVDKPKQSTAGRFEIQTIGGSMSVIQEKPIREVLAPEPQSHRYASRATGVAGSARIRYLRVALQLVGLTFIFGIYTLTVVWPSGWIWHTGRSSDYLQMILGVYATLGVFLLIASRNPVAHLSLIWFTVWSSVVHAAIMAVQALTNPEHIAHLWGDVPALLIVAGLLAFLTPRRSANNRDSGTRPVNN